MRNRDLGHRRRYDEFLDLPGIRLLDGGLDQGGCLVRLGLNQPMRNIALARSMSAAEGVAAVAYALCAPADHPTIWRRWSDVETAFAGQGIPALRRLPADDLLDLHPDGAALGSRYRLRIGRGAM